MKKRAKIKKMYLQVYTGGNHAAGIAEGTEGQILSLVEKIKTTSDSINHVKQFIQIGNALIKPSAVTHYYISEL